jgi:hypothetical protein
MAAMYDNDTGLWLYDEWILKEADWYEDGAGHLYIIPCHAERSAACLIWGTKMGRDISTLSRRPISSPSATGLITSSWIPSTPSVASMGCLQRRRRRLLASLQFKGSCAASTPSMDITTLKGEERCQRDQRRWMWEQSQTHRWG